MMTPPLPIGAAVIERLRESLPGHVYVLSAVDAAGIAESAQPTPAVHVIWSDYQLESQGAARKIIEVWTAWIVVQNVSNLVATESAIDEATPIFYSCLNAIDMWTPPGDHAPLMVQNPKFKLMYRNGVFYVPLTFYRTVIF
ncbi:MAG TPA: hypothetical protein ENO09_07220 [bacterium]|nr:hypothetical protein [bacterium]